MTVKQAEAQTLQAHKIFRAAVEKECEKTSQRQVAASLGLSHAAVTKALAHDSFTSLRKIANAINS